MSSPDGSVEVEVDSDACGSGSKLSDDSGIEDSWNDENSNMDPLRNSQNKQETDINDVGDLATKPVTNGVPFKSFTPLTPPKDQYMPVYGPMNIYPMASTESESLLTRTDIKDINAVPGVCGIENLGNTCFMNAGLQCIFAATSLKELISNEKSLGAVTNPENSQAVIKLVDRFQEMFQKILSGEFKSLYPIEFHSALTQVHSIFGDRKQHDCQEFISFLLNGLHDALNRVDPRKRQQHYQDSSRESSPRMSNLRLETSSESENDDQEETIQEVPKRMKMDVFEPEPDYGVECDEKLTQAQTAWRGYLKQNQSVIVDTYQGQFKSMVTCEKCHHVSVTFEPFMHVSVPIPYANEQQIVVHWRYRQRGEIPSNDMKTLRYLVTVSKKASVGDVQKQLLKVLAKENKVEEEDVIMAEVSNSCLIRTLVSMVGCLAVCYLVVYLGMIAFDYRVTSNQGKQGNQAIVSEFNFCHGSPRKIREVSKSLENTKEVCDLCPFKTETLFLLCWTEHKNIQIFGIVPTYSRKSLKNQGISSEESSGHPDLCDCDVLH